MTQVTLNDVLPIASCQQATCAVEAQQQEMIQRLRSRGANEDTVRLCLGMNHLDQIIQDNRCRKKHVFFASFPKSGTTYLLKVLIQSTGFVDYLIDRFSEDQQQNIVRQWIPMFLAQDTVTQIHMFATAPNTRMLKEIGVKPVVLVRDLLDTLVSLRDHFVRENVVVPMAQVPASFSQWNADKQYWFIVRMVTPWYLNFFVSWRRAAREVDVLWVRYDELISQTQGTVNRVLRHSGVEIDDERIRGAIAAVNLNNVRFNVGVSGRGRQLLSSEQQHAIADIAASFCGECDFSMIGL